MTLSQICQQCTDRACSVCPISKPCGCPIKLTACAAMLRCVALLLKMPSLICTTAI